jgi:hypothetical protein
MADPPDCYLQNNKDEELFYNWLEELPHYILDLGLGSRVAKARDPSWEMTHPIPPLPIGLLMRVLDALPPHIERRRHLWIENFPARERKRRWIAEG